MTLTVSLTDEGLVVVSKRPEKERELFEMLRKVAGFLEGEDVTLKTRAGSDLRIVEIKGDEAKVILDSEVTEIVVRNRLDQILLVQAKKGDDTIDLTKREEPASSSRKARPKVSGPSAPLSVPAVFPLGSSGEMAIIKPDLLEAQLSWVISEESKRQREKSTGRPTWGAVMEKWVLAGKVKAAAFLLEVVEKGTLEGKPFPPEVREQICDFCGRIRDGLSGIPHADKLEEAVQFARRLHYPEPEEPEEKIGVVSGVDLLTKATRLLGRKDHASKRQGIELLSDTLPSQARRITGKPGAETQTKRVQEALEKAKKALGEPFFQHGFKPGEKRAISDRIGSAEENFKKRSGKTDNPKGGGSWLPYILWRLGFAWWAELILSFASWVVIAHFFPGLYETHPALNAALVAAGFVVLHPIVRGLDYFVRYALHRFFGLKKPAWGLGLNREVFVLAIAIFLAAWPLFVLGPCHPLTVWALRVWMAGHFIINLGLSEAVWKAWVASPRSSSVDEDLRQTLKILLAIAVTPVDSLVKFSRIEGPQTSGSPINKKLPELLKKMDVRIRKSIQHTFGVLRELVEARLGRPITLEQLDEVLDELSQQELNDIVAAVRAQLGILQQVIQPSASNPPAAAQPTVAQEPVAKEKSGVFAELGSGVAYLPLSRVDEKTREGLEQASALLVGIGEHIDDLAERIEPRGPRGLLRDVREELQRISEMAGTILNDKRLAGVGGLSKTATDIVKEVGELSHMPDDVLAYQLVRRLQPLRNMAFNKGEEINKALAPMVTQSPQQSNMTSNPAEPIQPPSPAPLSDETSRQLMAKLRDQQAGVGAHLRQRAAAESSAEEQLRQMRSKIRTEQVRVGNHLRREAEEVLAQLALRERVARILSFVGLTSGALAFVLMVAQTFEGIAAVLGVAGTVLPAVLAIAGMAAPVIGSLQAGRSLSRMTKREQASLALGAVGLAWALVPWLIQGAWALGALDLRAQGGQGGVPLYALSVVGLWLPAEFRNRGNFEEVSRNPTDGEAPAPPGMKPWEAWGQVLGMMARSRAGSAGQEVRFPHSLPAPMFDLPAFFKEVREGGVEKLQANGLLALGILQQYKEFRRSLEGLSESDQQQVRERTQWFFLADHFHFKIGLDSFSEKQYAWDLLARLMGDLGISETDISTFLKTDSFIDASNARTLAERLAEIDMNHRLVVFSSSARRNFWGSESYRRYPVSFLEEVFDVGESLKLSADDFERFLGALRAIPGGGVMAQGLVQGVSRGDGFVTIPAAAQFQKNFLELLATQAETIEIQA